MKKDKYVYKPVLFYLLVFIATWGFWLGSLNSKNITISSILMLLGLISPALTAIGFVFMSGNDELQSDFKRKVRDFYHLDILSIITAIAVFGLVVVISILLSIIFGQSFSQFSLVDGFSFSINGTSALFTILLASCIEEVGWRGYGEDSIAEYYSWFRESILFGCIWSLWHLPLFWIPGTYHFGLRELGFCYMANFLISVVPLGFLTTWVYVKNNRSMLACIIFHIFVNFMQEKIAMTPQTKCIETMIIVLVAVIVVKMYKNLFFERKHIGRLLEVNFKDSSVTSSGLK